MNIERFHNALALNLGYDRIVNDRRFVIKMDDTIQDPMVTLTVETSQNSVSFSASEDAEEVFCRMQKAMGALAKEQIIKEIIDAVHQAYIDANYYFFYIQE